MKTQVRFVAARFQPVPGEEDEDSEDYINDGCFARQLADFLTAALQSHGYIIRDDVVEYWGIWLELHVDGPITFAVCCGNVDDTGHRVFTHPFRPIVRRWFRRHDVTAELAAPVGARDKILRAEDDITELTWEEPG